MAINIEMNIKGSDDQYQTVYPQTTTDNVIGLNTELSNLESQFNQALTNYFTKDQTLQDSTATMFRLNVDAVPDDVFAFLGKYAQYWWRRILSPREMSSSQETLSNYIVTNFPGTSSSNIITFHVANSFTLGDTTEDIPTITLDNPVTETSSPLSMTTFTKKVVGKYVQFNPIVTYYFPADATLTRNGTNVIADKVMQVTPFYTNNPGNMWQYIQSSSHNAYPDSGTQDGYKYEYLDIPFDNAVTAPKIKTGSYTGTGTYGADNPNTLTFEFEPKFVVIMNAGTSDNAFMLLPNSWGVSKGYICPEVSTQSFGDSIDYVFSGNSVSWYSDDNSGSQANGTGGVYGYFALG